MLNCCGILALYQHFIIPVTGQTLSYLIIKTRRFYSLKSRALQILMFLQKKMRRLQKYCALASDFRIMYQMPVKIIPVVIGHSGVISSQCRHFLHDIPGYCDSLLCHLLKATILGTICTLQTTDL